MSRLRLRPWPFDKNEEVELYWHGVPFLNQEGLWMLKCLFKSCNESFTELIFPFGTLPYLRIGQIYIDGDLSERMGTGSIFEVRVTEHTKFEICKGFDFPKSLYAFSTHPAPFYGNLPVCKFENTGIMYYIPCTEIVRGILTPNKMIANQILRPEGLGCFIERSFCYRNRIELQLTEEYHQDLLKDEVISYFVWLKYNASASKEWDSVYKNMILDATQCSSGYAAYALQKGIPIRVTPPVSGSSTWTFRGLQYKNHRLILELLFRSNLESPYAEIEVFHSKLEKSQLDGLPRYKNDLDKSPSDDKDAELNTTGESAEKRQNHSIIEQPSIMFSFKIKPRVFRRKSKTSNVHNGDTVILGTKPDDDDNSLATTQEWVRGGKIPQIEFSTLQIVDASLSKGLDEFLKMIEYIQLHYKKLKLTCSITPLPQIKSFSQYEDGSIRTCAIVIVEYLGHLPCYIIEVGRADGWSISTLVVKPITDKSVETSVFESLIQRLLNSLINSSGHWNRDFFRNEHGYIFDTAKHMSEQPFNRWAGRIIEKMY